jgi:hypothetical protein
MLAHTAQPATPDPAMQDELDRGPRWRGAGVERFCAASRTVKPVDELIRFVLGPDGVVPDLKRKLPGRGLWITADRATLANAVARNVFARGFKRDVRVTPELVAQTERLLARAALDALAIAGKSGLVAAGFAQVEAALAREQVVALLHARDAGSDGVAKLAGALRRRPDADRVAVVTDFTSAQLDLALGRSNMVHAALLAGPASSGFLARWARLERFRTGDTGEGGRNRPRN